MALRSRYKKSFCALLLAFAVVLVSFSTSITADAATSYSTPVTLDVSGTLDPGIEFSFLSLANSVNPDSVDPVYKFDGTANYDYLYRATLDFPIYITFPYPDFATFLLYNSFTINPQLNSTLRAIGCDFEILNYDSNINVSLRQGTNPWRTNVYIRSQDLSLAQSKLITLTLRVHLYFDREESGAYSPIPQSVGSCSIAATDNLIKGQYKHGDAYTTQLYDIIGKAIDNAPSLLEAVELLDSIADDAALLTQVLSHVSSLDSKFQDFYNLLAAYNATGSQNTATLQYFDAIRVYLQRLQAAVTGWSSNAATTPANLAQLTFDRWVSIITTALNNQAPDVTQAAEEQANVQNMSDNQHAQEAVMFSRAADSLDDIDLNVNWPSGIISTAVSLMALTGMIWERLGDFQFIAIATLSAGVVITLLGVVNRFPRGDGGDFSNDERRLNSLARSNNPDHTDTHWHK